MAKKTDSTVLAHYNFYQNEKVKLSNTARVDDNGVFYVKAFDNKGKWVGIRNDDIRFMVDYHKTIMIRKYNRLYKYFKGEHLSIIKQRNKASYKPDNRIVANYPKQLVNAFTGYFSGEAPDISVTANNDDVENETEIDNANTDLKHFNRLNQIDEFYSKQAKYVDIFGSSLGMVYQDELANTRVTALDPRDGFVVYSDDIRKVPVISVLYTGTDELGHDVISIYANSIGVFSNESGINHVEQSNLELHGYVVGEVFNNDPIEMFPSSISYGRLPMVEFKSSDERMGIYEDLLTVIDAINSAISEKKNDVDYFGDAFLKVINFTLNNEPEEGLDFKENRVFEGRLDGEGKGDIDFINKPSADGTQENLITRLVQIIYDISGIVNLNDKDFTNAASGTALKQRLQGMRQLAKTKASSFQRSMTEIYRCLFNGLLKPDMVDNVNIKPNFNEPIDLLDISQSLVNLMNVRASGGISLDTILTNTQIISDAQAEIARIKAEREEVVEENPDLGLSNDGDTDNDKGSSEKESE